MSVFMIKARRLSVTTSIPSLPLEKPFFSAPDPEEVTLNLFVPVDQLDDRRANTVLIIY